VFALYNGLVFLPVLLSLFGPLPKKDLKLGGLKEIPLQNLPTAGGGGIEVSPTQGSGEEREACISPGFA